MATTGHVLSRRFSGIFEFKELFHNLGLNFFRELDPMYDVSNELYCDINVFVDTKSLNLMKIELRILI